MPSVYLEAFQRHNVDASKFHFTIHVEWKDMSSTNKRKAATKKRNPQRQIKVKKQNQNNSTKHVEKYYFETPSEKKTQKRR